MESTLENAIEHVQHDLRNKGVIVRQKSPFKLREIWAIRVRLQLQHRVRELAMFDWGLDSKLRACDLVKMRVRDICHGERISPTATVTQQKTSRPVQFEIKQPTRDAVSNWIKEAKLGQDGYLFPSRIYESPHIGTRQYARIVASLVTEIGLNPSEYATHLMRRTKASLIYWRTKTCVRYNCFLATPSWRALCGTWALRWRMRWRWPSNRKFNRRLSSW